MARGEHEAVAVRPDRVGGVEAQEALPERVGDRGQRHRRPRVAGVRLLDRVDRQRPDRVDAELVDVGHGCRLSVAHPRRSLADGAVAVYQTLTQSRLSRAEIEAEKRLAAEAAAELVEDGMPVGLGTGSTVAHLLPALAARELEHPLRRDLGRDRGRGARARDRRSSRSTDLERLDIAIDGADQVAPDGWLVKGGGGAHTREKIVAAAAERFVVIADSSKPVDAIARADPARAAAVRARRRRCAELGDVELARRCRAVARRRRDRRLRGRGRRPGRARGAARRDPGRASTTACSRRALVAEVLIARGDEVERLDARRTLSGVDGRAAKVGLRPRAVADQDRVGAATRPAGIDSSPASSLASALALVVAGDQPEDAARGGERRVGEGHPAAALVLAGSVSATRRSVDLEHRVAGDQRGGVAVGAEAEVDEVERARAASSS